LEQDKQHLEAEVEMLRAEVDGRGNAGE
jgi:hypothetical protein